VCSLAHWRERSEAADIPVNADFEGGFADDPDGDRLTYSNGIILLAVIAGGLIYAFGEWVGTLGGEVPSPPATALGIMKGTFELDLPSDSSTRP